MTAGITLSPKLIALSSGCAMSNELQLAFLNAKAHFFDSATTSLIV